MERNNAVQAAFKTQYVTRFAAIIKCLMLHFSWMANNAMNRLKSTIRKTQSVIYFRIGCVPWISLKYL